ncbi:MAG: glycosyltransferase, partial [Muribaculaceae bacterium]|nr:glycosyltransferase [Muribaculaceae bacterium]
MIVFISNFFNHHQVPLAEELYRLTQGQYRFIEQVPMPDEFLKGGYPDYSDSPMLLQAWRGEAERREASRLTMEADIVIYGNILSYHDINRRLAMGKLTFEYGERWFKRGLLNLLSPRLLRSQWYYHTRHYRQPLYRLNSSAFAASDLSKMRSFRGKGFKWAYFTRVESIDADTIVRERQSYGKTRFISVARLIPLKQIDHLIKACSILKNQGITDFETDLYGSGPEEGHLKSLIERLGLQDHVTLRGNLPNDAMLAEMRKYDALVFCSNRKEGWGAVVNEAMSSACTVIGSNSIGSIPYLIKDGENGFIYTNGNVDMLAAKMKKLIESEDLRMRLGIA